MDDERIIYVDNNEYGINRVSQEEEANKAFEPIAIPAYMSVWWHLVQNASNLLSVQSEVWVNLGNHNTL